MKTNNKYYNLSNKYLAIQIILFILLFLIISKFNLKFIDHTRVIPTLLLSYLYPILHLDQMTFLEFAKSLRTLIPPLFGLIEKLTINYVGFSKIYQIIYIVGFFSAFFISALILKKSFKHYLHSLFISIFLLCTGFFLHQEGNPIISDIFYPLFFLLLLLCLKKAFVTPKKTKQLFLLAGLCLSFLELTRPFMIFFVPVIIFFVYKNSFSVKHLKKQFIYFILPFIIISGFWHLKLIIFNNGQLLWSNHGIYNFANTWPWTVGKHYQDVKREDSNYLNYNTQDFYLKSRHYQKIIIANLIKHPFHTISYFYKRLAAIVTIKELVVHNVQTTLSPLHILLYRIIVFACYYWFFWNLFISIKNKSIFNTFEGLLVLFVVFVTFIIAAAGDNEEGRFMIWLLPLLSVLPNNLSKN